MNREAQEQETVQKAIDQAGFLWNAAYAGLNATQAAVILFAISRTYDIAMAGIITIGFAIANLSCIVSRYGIRNYQVTDVTEKYRFPDYFLCRLITTGSSLLLSLAYLLSMALAGHYPLEKSLIILEIVVLKTTDALEDVFVGRLQQLGRLDVGARIAALRLGMSTVVIFSSLWVVPSLPICLLLGIVSEIVMDACLIPSVRKHSVFPLHPLDFSKMRRLLLVGLPLGLGMVLHNYAGNAPKYLVDLHLTDELQAVCGYVMMPMFVLAVLNTFVMQPAVKGLGDAWNTDSRLFWKKVVRHISLISVLSAAVLGAGLLVGLPLLSALYRVDLLPYRKAFLILMAGGGLYTISSYMIVLLTTMRRQIGIVWGCLAAIAVYLAFGDWASRKGGFTGACDLYIVANAAMVAVFLVVLLGRKACTKGLRTKLC
jgi:O-antigen/teichoic acid export membrane protein